MTLKARITADMKTAMKEKQVDRLGTIRLLLAAIKQREVDERIELDDAAITAIIDKMLKQRKDSITQFEAANRHDLADQEKAEVAVLIDYMPQQLTAEEIAAILDAAIATHGATAAAMGKIMAEIKPQLAGRADMAEVSKLVKARMA
ncbi:MULTISPECIES: GatB/YqeY domain-containing protein [Deefgea]|uniref:GatB/YqeY domain-containing protein n=1 Tax=Deefgea chitinilytica TaxID=570276 RepID=A0ABS2CDR5_9NEIS|nr:MULTISPECIES: GatB/YqeY domain-containing protein [Deefgea]MBM5572297.1 GatB/YqeY domain-containing protein [Deefgea chitinilytica]MBM9889533.1 GatB/YqeY domain-containing protein [Deefgea sp. CFH1-16]